MQKAFVRRLTLAGSLLLLLGAPGRGVAGGNSGHVPLVLDASEPRFESTAGGLLARIDGFGETSRPGEPALPVRILLVAIPEGATPALRVIDSESRLLASFVPAPVPRVRVRDRGAAHPERDATPDFRRDGAVYRGAMASADAPVRLGRIGYLRDQRFVEIVYTPIVVAPGARQATFFPHLTLDVDLGDIASEPPLQAFRPDPFFESTYRSSLVNYEQGKRFRVSGRAAPSGTTAPGAAAGATTVESAPAPMSGSGVRYKMSVSRAGVYRLTQAYLSANAPALVGTDPRTWSIQVDGTEIPIAIRDAAGASGEADGVFGAGDTLDFYGRSKTEPPTVLNYDFQSITPNVFQANDFTDTQVYWLVAAGAAGSHRRIPSVAGAPLSGYPQASDWAATATWEDNSIFFPLGDADPYFSYPGLLAASSDQQRDLPLPLPGLVPSAQPATVFARLRGGSDLTSSPDHRTRIWVNSDTANATDFTWDGQVIQEQTWSVPQASLSNPATLHALAVTQTGISVDRQYLDRLQVTYRRDFTAAGETLEFTVPNSSATYRIAGLSSAAPVVYEVGRPIAANGEADAVQVGGAAPSGAPTSAWTFEVPADGSQGAPATRTFVVAGNGGVLLPDAIVQAADPVLAVPGQAADMLVIAARSAVDASAGGSLDLLLQHRLAAQGLTSRVVFIDQVYDEFSGGRRDANAVRSFLAYAYANWRGASGLQPPPSFVLLVGDATPDYKNNLARTDWVDQVPTPIMLELNDIIGYYSSDNWLASVNGSDQIPDLHLGRITTRTPAQSAAVFDKIRAFETTPPSGTWKGRIIVSASDGKEPGESDQFKAIGDALVTDYFSAPPMTAWSPKLYYDTPPWNATDYVTFNSDLKTALNSGAAVITYIGHGNFDNWGLDTLLTAADAAALTNGLKLPFLFNSNCLSGGFHYFPASGATAENFVNNPGGGAIAAFAPSGLSFSFIGSVVSDHLFDTLFGPTRERRLGPATLSVRTALWAQGSITDLQAYTFLGDPASTIATPAPPPPTGLAAAAGNGFVDLSWTPPAVPAAETRLYRAASSPTAAYTRIACSATSPSSCRDTGVMNATRYYYFAVSADADGFEGAVSNLNADCDAGPGCVTARPINPNPPAIPSGLQVMDPGSGGRLDVSWNANPEPDVKTYNVRFGTVSGSYTSVQAVAAPATGTALLNLTTGVRYYVSLTAVNTSGLESQPAPEQSETPLLFQGIAPPRAIDTLTVATSGTNIVLTWTRPTVDIYGRPTTVAAYHVYRGTTPNFPVSAASLLATINDGSIVTYTHTGGVTLAGNSYYLVTAVDTGGLVSGAGRELPNGVGDMTVSLAAPPNTVHLTWPTVTTDVQGLPTLVDHYQIHVTSTPVSRAGLGAATLFMDNVTATSLDVTLPAGSRFYISVLTVDNRGNLSPF
jgi:fibronectin type 3 domain-containing protein